MRASYGAELRKLFPAELSAAISGFVAAKPPPPDLLPGSRAFVRKVTSSIWHWVVVVPSPKDDSFWVDIGWSKLARFPQSAWPSAPGEEYMCRLTQLGPARLHAGWDVDAFLRTSQAKDILAFMPGALQSNPETRVLVSLKACMQLLSEAAAPFFEQVA